MSKNTGIEWTDHTWSPWWGCTKISPGCAACYAAELAVRWRGLEYKRGVPRQLTKDWDAPKKWDRQAAKAGERRRVFPSMCDIFDDEVPPDWRVSFFHLVSETRHLDWLILTKRPENIKRFHGGDGIPRSWPENMPPNVWLGVSVESQEYAWRIGQLLKTPARIHFASYEPALGPLNLVMALRDEKARLSFFDGQWRPDIEFLNRPFASFAQLPRQAGLDWLIVGGESGNKARPCNVNDVRSVVQQCKAAEIPVFVKQLGSNIRGLTDANGVDHDTIAGILGSDYRLTEPKGGGMEEWPLDLRVREFPDAA